MPNFVTADWVVPLFTGVIAFATVAYVVFTILLWRETKKSADAAEINAKVLMESQRPQIGARPHGNPTQTLADLEAPRVQIELTNRGLTPAYDFVYESWIEVLALPFQDFTAAADYFKSADRIVLYPNHEPPLVINIPLRGGLSQERLDDLRRLRLHACLRIRVEYRDAFSPIRYANFGFVVMANGLSFLPKYNDAN